VDVEGAMRSVVDQPGSYIFPLQSPTSAIDHRTWKIQGFPSAQPYLSHVPVG
jgi:hypothetical protein